MPQENCKKLKTEERSTLELVRHYPSSVGLTDYGPSYRKYQLKQQNIFRRSLNALALLTLLGLLSALVGACGKRFYMQLEKLEVAVEEDVNPKDTTNTPTSSVKEEN